MNQKIMANYFDCVREFHQVFQHPIRDITDKPFCFEEDKKLVEFRFSLIQEEICEYLEARKLSEVVDALCDIIYVLTGTYISLGIRAPDIFNMDILELSKRVDLERCIHDLRHSINTRDRELFLLTLDTVYVYCDLLGKMYTIPISDCFMEVHLSNMSKSCDTESLAQRTVDSYMSKNIPASYRPSGNRWIVYNTETGKILKSLEYNPVDLSRFDN